MKHKAVQALIAQQHAVPIEDVTVKFISGINGTYKFKVTVLNNSLSVANGHPYREELKVTVKEEPWVEGN